MYICVYIYIYIYTYIGIYMCLYCVSGSSTSWQLARRSDACDNFIFANFARGGEYTHSRRGRLLDSGLCPNGAPP